jgi:signal transduction histidine kinase/CheY-like chemotaxis protein
MTNDIMTVTSTRPLWIGIGAGVVIFLTAMISGGALYFRAEQALREEVRADLRRAAVIAASSIDGDLHAKITDPTQENGPIYEQAIAPLRNIIRTSVGIRFIYTCILKNGQVYFILDPVLPGDHDGDGVEDHSSVMDVYDEANSVLLSVLKGGPAATDHEPIEDRWGWTFSGYAPFHNKLGQVVGAVGIDIDLATYQERVGIMRSAVLQGGFMAFLCSALVGWLMHRFALSLQRARSAAHSHAESLLAARQEAEQANRAKDEFLAVISHEIRTPLNAVIGLADLLLSDVQSAGNQRHLRTIRSSGEHLLSMINDILDHSKIMAGGMVLEEIPFSPKELVEGVQALMRGSAEAKNLQLQVQIEGPIMDRALGDPGRLRQVLMNLVANAIKFTAKGTITLGLKATIPGGPVTMSVRDTGIGINQAMQKRLFKPFQQGDSSIARRYGGTGLGLSISQRLVIMMGGTIQVDSAEGRGSVFSFTITLPPTHEPTTAISKATTVEFIPQFSGTVLVVDDREVNRFVVGAMLKRLGFMVEEAEDGHAALERLKNPGIDVVLMDCQMPGLDGLAATADLRIRESEGNGKRTPVIALSAAVLPAERERCRLAGMDGFLAKPLRLDNLIEEIQRHVPQKNKSQHHARPSVGAEFAPVCDEEIFKNLLALADDPKIIAQMIKSYLRDLEQDLAQMSDAAHAGQVQVFARRAHALKGASLTMGLMPLAHSLERCARLEQGGEKKIGEGNGENSAVSAASAASAPLGQMSELLNNVKEHAKNAREFMLATLDNLTKK